MHRCTLLENSCVLPTSSANWRMSYEACQLFTQVSSAWRTSQQSTKGSSSVLSGCATKQASSSYPFPNNFRSKTFSKLMKNIKKTSTSSVRITSAHSHLHFRPCFPTTFSCCETFTHTSLLGASVGSILSWETCRCWVWEKADLSDHLRWKQKYHELFLERASNLLYMLPAVRPNNMQAEMKDPSNICRLRMGHFTRTIRALIFK